MSREGMLHHIRTMHRKQFTSNYLEDWSNTDLAELHIGDHMFYNMSVISSDCEYEYTPHIHEKDQA